MNQTIPQEILEVILSFTQITRTFLCDLALVSKQFYSISKNDTYWKESWIKRFPDSIHIIKNNYRYATIELCKYRRLNQHFDNKKQSLCTVEDVKITIFGAKGCGKTRLIHTYCNIYDSDWDPTIEDSYRKLVKRGERNIMAEILDASLDGLSLNNILTTVEFQALIEMNVRSAHGFFLVCSMDKEDSIKNLETIMTLIYSTKDAKPGSLPMLLVINKSDKRNERVLSEIEINDFVERHKIRNCLETSTYSYQNINVAFDTLIGETYNTINDLNRVWTKIANGERPSDKKKNKCSIG